MLTRDTFTGPWAGLPVAWTDRDAVDEQTYRGDVARCCEAGIPGVYTGGTTGEFYAMEFDEFRIVARATVEECQRRGKPAVSGVRAKGFRGHRVRPHGWTGRWLPAYQPAQPWPVCLGNHI